jgi:hypothetical protein
LGSLLVERGLLSPEALGGALARQSGSGRRLGEVLVEMGLLGEEALRWALAEQMDIPLVHPDPAALDPEALALLPASVCRRYGVLPLYLSEEQPGGPKLLTLAAADPANRLALDDVAARAGRNLRVVAALREEIEAALDAIHGPAPREDVGVRSSALPAESLPTIREDPTGNALLRGLLEPVAARGEGGFHVSARAGETRVEDLEGRPLFVGGDAWHGILLDRLRRLAGLAPAPAGSVLERGRVAFAPGGGPVSLFRLSILSGLEGAEAQVKLLRPESRRRSLAELGFTEAQVRAVGEAIERPGLLWVTSAGEEGLASTLFALLREIPGTGRTVTLEEEVGYLSPEFLQLDAAHLGAQGTAEVLRELKHLDFDRVVVDRAASSLLPSLLSLALRKRWVLAATPGVVLGEGVRELAARAPDAPLSALRLLVHQRLVPRLCPGCRVACRPDRGEWTRWAGETPLPDQVWEEGSGCEACRGKGTTGSRAFFAVLPVGPAEREALYAQGGGEDAAERLWGGARAALRLQLAAAAAEGTIAFSELGEGA